VKRVNLKVLVILVTTAVVGFVGIYALRRFQVVRNAGNLARLAKIRLDEGKPAEAMELYGRYIGLRPEDHAAYAEYATLLLGRAEAPDATRNDLARAYNALEAAVRRNPENDTLRRRLAEYQLRLGRAVDAREHLLVLRERLERGEITPASTATNRPDSDREPASDAAGTALDAKQVDVLIARSYLGAGDFAEAASLTAKMVGFDLAARRFNPDQATTDASTDAYIILAAILDERLNDDAAAAAVVDKLVERRGEDIQAWLARSSWHRDHGDIDAAEADIARAIDLAPENPNCLFAGYELALARKDFDAAASLAGKARDLYPGDERVYRGLAAVALQRGDLKAAEQVLLDGIDVLPNKASLLLMLADTRLQLNQLDDVGQTVERIKELYGQTSPAVAFLEGRLLIAQGRWNDAKIKLESVRPLVIESPELVRQVDLYLGQCHAQLDEFDAQLDVNRRVLSEDPKSLAARAGTAAALAAAGKPDEALEQFEAIAAEVPADRLPGVPQVWYPLLKLRIQHQASKPAAERDWSSVDSLVEILQEAPEVTAAQLALLRADILMRKGEAGAARDLLDDMARRDGSPQVWAALATLVLRTAGAEDARRVIEGIPAEVAATAPVLTVRAQVAARLDAPSEPLLATIEKEAAALPDADACGVLATLASIHLDGGNAVEAERIWRDVAKRRPDDVRPREAVLDLLLAQGDVDKARAAAQDIASIAGRTNARSRVANARVLIADIRTALRKRQSIEDQAPKLSTAETATLNDARNLLIEAENDRPNWSQIQTLFAEIDLLKGDVPAAIDRLKKANDLASNPGTVRQLVALLYSQNRLEEAQKALGTLGTEGADGFERLTAEMEVRAGKFDEAVTLAERSVRGTSSNADDLLWLGQLLDRSGKTERAADALTRATEVAPKRPDVWLALFSHQVVNGRKQAAARTLDRAVELMDDPQRQLTRAQGYEMLGLSDDAEKAFREAVASAPDDPDVNRGFATFLVRTGRLGPARETLQKIIDSRVESTGARSTKAWARRTLAEVIADRGGFKETERAMELLRQNADAAGEPSAEDMVLQIKLLTNRPEPVSWRRAIQAFEELRRKQPLSMGQRITLAQLYERVGRWNDGRAELTSVVAAPSAPPAYIAMLIEKMIDHGEASSAKPWLARLQKVSPDSAITLALEARLAIAENDRKAAAEAARKLMPGAGVSGTEPGQLSAIARLMEQLGFPKAADKVLAQYAEAAPEGVVARADFLGRLKRTDEALELLESRWDDVPLERLLSSGVQAARLHDDPAATAARIDPWFVKAKRVDPGSIMVLLLEAESRTLQNRPDEAEKIYRDLLARTDLDAVQKAIVSNNLAFHLARPDSVTEAKSLIQAAIDELGPLPDLLDTRGMIHLAAGETKAAVADLEEAVLLPTDAKFLHLAWAQFRDGDKVGAKESLEAGRRKGLAMSRLSGDDRKKLAELELEFGAASPTGAVPQG
jgi:tetratricopeptide (TPR) repeat protein